MPSIKLPTTDWLKPDKSDFDERLRKIEFLSKFGPCLSNVLDIESIDVSSSISIARDLINNKIPVEKLSFSTLSDLTCLAPATMALLEKITSEVKNLVEELRKLSFKKLFKFSSRIGKIFSITLPDLKDVAEKAADTASTVFELAAYAGYNMAARRVNTVLSAVSGALLAAIGSTDFMLITMVLKARDRAVESILKLNAQLGQINELLAKIKQLLTLLSFKDTKKADSQRLGAICDILNQLINEYGFVYNLLETWKKSFSDDNSLFNASELVSKLETIKSYHIVLENALLGKAALPVSYAMAYLDSRLPLGEGDYIDNLMTQSKEVTKNILTESNRVLGELVLSVLDAIEAYCKLDILLFEMLSALKSYFIFTSLLTEIRQKYIYETVKFFIDESHETLTQLRANTCDVGEKLSRRHLINISQSKNLILLALKQLSYEASFAPFVAFWNSYYMSRVLILSKLKNTNPPRTINEAIRQNWSKEVEDFITNPNLYITQGQVPRWKVGVETALNDLIKELKKALSGEGEVQALSDSVNKAIASINLWIAFNQNIIYDLLSLPEVFGKDVLNYVTREFENLLDEFGIETGLPRDFINDLKDGQIDRLISLANGNISGAIYNFDKLMNCLNIATEKLRLTGRYDLVNEINSIIADIKSFFEVRSLEHEYIAKSSFRIKLFNFGNTPAEVDTYIDNILAFLEKAYKLYLILKSIR